MDALKKGGGWLAMVLFPMEFQPSGMSCELIIFFPPLRETKIGGRWVKVVHSCTSSEVWSSLFLTCLLPSHITYRSCSEGF